MTYQPSPQAFATLPLEIYDIVADARRAPPSDLASARRLIDQLTEMLTRPGLGGAAVRELETPQPEQREGGMPLWKARKAAALIDDSLEAVVQIEDVAHHVNLSSAHFARTFRVSFGMTFSRFVLQRRLIRARSLMLDTPSKLADISLRCGFADQAHMTRHFSKEVGLSPARWRRVNKILLH